MKISLIINTCCRGPRAHEVTGSTTPTPHALRDYALTNFILPAYLASPDVDQVVVTGEYGAGAGYLSVWEPSTHFSCVDALAQRQKGADVASGDILIFTHDDHFFPPEQLANIRRLWRFLDADVVVPSRWMRNEKGDVRLNNGMPDYVGGHAVMMTREAVKVAPWEDVLKVHVWDNDHTRLMREEGLRIREEEGIRVYDVEFGGVH